MEGSIVAEREADDDLDEIDEAEEQWLIQAYDEAMASGDEAIPLEQALEEIEQSRRTDADR